MRFEYLTTQFTINAFFFELSKYRNNIFLTKSVYILVMFDSFHRIWMPCCYCRKIIHSDKLFFIQIDIFFA